MKIFGLRLRRGWGRGTLGSASAWEISLRAGRTRRASADCAGARRGLRSGDGALFEKPLFGQPLFNRPAGSWAEARDARVLHGGNGPEGGGFGACRPNRERAALAAVCALTAWRWYRAVRRAVYRGGDAHSRTRRRRARGPGTGLSSARAGNRPDLRRVSGGAERFFPRFCAESWLCARMRAPVCCCCGVRGR